MHKPSARARHFMAMFVVTAILYVLIGTTTMRITLPGLRGFVAQVLGCALFMYGYQMGRKHP